MTILSILKFPDPRLHKIAKPVTIVDERIRQIAADMGETMYEANGVGLQPHRWIYTNRITIGGNELNT